MTINSFGYEVMSLDEIISALTQIKAAYPGLANKPVWITNCPPLYWPIKNIQVRKPDIIEAEDDLRTEILVERGGN